MEHQISWVKTNLKKVRYRIITSVIFRYMLVADSVNGTLKLNDTFIIMTTKLILFAVHLNNNNCFQCLFTETMIITGTDSIELIKCEVEALCFLQSNGPSDAYSAISSVDKERAEPEKLRIWREEQKMRLEKKGNSIHSNLSRDSQKNVPSQKTWNFRIATCI